MDVNRIDAIHVLKVDITLSNIERINESNENREQKLSSYNIFKYWLLVGTNILIEQLQIFYVMDGCK